MNIYKQYSLLRLLSNYSRNINSRNYYKKLNKINSPFSGNNLPFTKPNYSEQFEVVNQCYCTTKSNECWRCGHSVTSSFCGNCKSLQRVNKTKNYFELLEVNYNYDLKLAYLTQNYRKLQSVLHPDKFGNKSKEEKEISEEYSSVINKAYSTLSNPVKRGLYMLNLKGLNIEDTIQADPTFLMEIMEINEKIENEKDIHKLSEYNRINKEQLNSLIRELSLAFQDNNLSTAKDILTKLKYFTNIDSKIKDIKQKMGFPD